MAGNSLPREISKDIYKRHIQLSNLLGASNVKAGKFDGNSCMTNDPFKWFYGFRFKTKHQLINHAKLHDEFKPFVCTVCQKRFRQAYGLTVHKRSHDGIYPYDCKYCGRKFRHTSSLKVRLEYVLLDFIIHLNIFNILDTWTNPYGWKTIFMQSVWLPKY